MGRKKGVQKKNPVLKQTAEIASVALEALEASSAAFPPLQSVAGAALYISKLVQNFRKDNEQWIEFNDYVQNQVKKVIENISNDVELPANIKESIQHLSSTLDRIGKEIQDIQDKSKIRRLLAYSANPGAIADMKQHLDEAIRLLTFKNTLATGLDVATIGENQKQNAIVHQTNHATTNKRLDRLERNVEMIASKISATALPYTTTAGWDDTKTCLVGTRRAFTDAVLDWVRQPNLHGTQQIFLLADVVGSGKTALAHTIAEKCSDLGLLISAFFFGSKPGQNNPRSFVFNLARDLASRFPQVAENISQALKGDPNMLLSQPVSRLFKALVFQPVIETNIVEPLVVVIDALNEAESAEMQNILRTQIPKFPGNFRVFVTSRPDRSVLRGLGPEISPVDLAIHGAENHADIAVYVDYKLAEISLEHNLDNWPDPRLITEFLGRVEGLFIWVAIICEYLMQVSCPDRMLERLLASIRETQLLPEQKIDQLYSTVLDGPQWDDIDFLEGYPQVMGTLVVQRIPMTVDALQQLHGSMPRVRNILFPMASLITGLHSAIQPAQILHTSFREYITQRAKGKRQIQAKFHHGRLVTLCLEVLNTLFSVKIIGSGYMQRRRWSEIEDVEVEHFTEEQWYAVEFWVSHLVQVGTPTPEIITPLREFLSRNLATWIEVVVSKRRYQSLIPMRKWVETAQATLVGHITHKGMSNPLRRLPKRLAEEGRHNEALQVVEDLKDITKHRRPKPAVQKEVIGSKRKECDEDHRAEPAAQGEKIGSMSKPIFRNSPSLDSMKELQSVSDSADDELDTDTTSSWSDSDSE